MEVFVWVGDGDGLCIWLVYGLFIWLVYGVCIRLVYGLCIWLVGVGGGRFQKLSVLLLRSRSAGCGVGDDGWG